MTSDKQLKANQENAKLGGVKTQEGKAVSKYNALTHGILSQSITDYEKDFYSKILEELEVQYSPQGITEKLIVERVALYYLKLYRVQKAETEYMNSKLHPRVTKQEAGSLSVDMDSLLGKEVVIKDGYSPQINQDDILHLMEIYGRYEVTVENRLYRALHELERTQRLRNGEKILPPITADISQMGSFGENDKNI